VRFRFHYALPALAAAIGLAAVASPPAHAALPYGPYTCAGGYVWRAAYSGDAACVTPDDRSIVSTENALGPSRVQPGGGAWGPATCLSGYVWRVAGPPDLVCVPPASRDREAANNRNAFWTLADPTQTPWGGISASSDAARYSTGDYVTVGGSGVTPNAEIRFYVQGRHASGTRYGPYQMWSLRATSSGTIPYGSTIGWLSCDRYLEGPPTVVVLDTGTGKVTTAGLTYAPTVCGYA
jgi:hypothetical protein